MMNDPFLDDESANPRMLLGREAIERLNRDGANLQADKFYAQFFLINSEPNTAADPYSFQIVPESLERIAKTAVGRPFVLGANAKKHTRGPNGIFSKPEEIIEYQKKFAAGEIVHEYINPGTNNANVIVEIFPEYVQDLKSGKIPHYVSPLIENKTTDFAVRNGRILVRDGRILHLQAVDTPGYGEVATIHGTCEGMLDTCMNELRALGAAGMLKLSQSEEILMRSVSDSGLKEDVAIAAEILQGDDSTTAQHDAEIIADFEVHTKKLSPEQRAARIKQLVDSGMDLGDLASYLQSYLLRMGIGTAGASAKQVTRKPVTKLPLEENPMLKELQATITSLQAQQHNRQPVGFELEEYIRLSPRERQRQRILGASGRQSPSPS